MYQCLLKPAFSSGNKAHALRKVEIFLFHCSNIPTHMDNNNVFRIWFWIAIHLEKRFDFWPLHLVTKLKPVIFFCIYHIPCTHDLLPWGVILSTPPFEGEIFKMGSYSGGGVIFSISSFHFWRNEIHLKPLQNWAFYVKKRDLWCVWWAPRVVIQGREPGEGW